MTWFFSTGMTPSRDIDVEAPFAVAFKARGMGWAESVISLGALAAITTALLSSLMGQPRVYMAMARDGLLPAWFAKVHPKFGTPANASAFTGITTGVLALVVDIETLAELVSIGTLAVFGSVCASLLVWRHSPAPGEEEEEDEGVDGGGVSARSAATRRAGALVASCVAFGASHRAWSLGNGTNADLYLFCAVAPATARFWQPRRLISWRDETNRQRDLKPRSCRTCPRSGSPRARSWCSRWARRRG